MQQQMEWHPQALSSSLVSQASTSLIILLLRKETLKAKFEIM